MKVLIVHAHHESKSFSSALFQQAVKTFTEQAHEVATSDLYTQHFDPVSDRRNFKTVADPGYLKQQMEERLASDQHGFAPELEAEIAKLEACDLLVFCFPLWWFGMPAILKGWVDRVFAMRRIYGDGKLYENGLGKGVRRAMVIMTTGGPPEAYSGNGLQPPLATILTPIEHGVFWFNGFLPLDAFVAYGPVRMSQEERVACLLHLDQRLRGLDGEKPRQLPPMSDFPPPGPDRKKRFMVTATFKDPADESFKPLIPAERAHIAELKREGHLLTFHMTAPGSAPWRGYLLFRESGEAEVQAHLETLPMTALLEFHIVELAP